MKIFLFLAAMMSASVALAEPPIPKKEGIESRGYTWNAQEGEKIKALKLKGDKVKGEEIYEICSACHLASGAGRPDGTFPRLAGQHASVLIKQMADIRAGLRDNPSMYSFAIMLANPQEIADVSAYIESQCIPPSNGKYEGSDAAVRITQGKTLYEKQCLKCHGKNGEGDRKQLYPAVAGQHYKYLLRQAIEIREGHRRNANLEMLRAIKTYNDDMLSAVSAYQASLKMPGVICKNKK
ncbi:MAG: c-type cytochrome [Azoarcus sp.]|jgi:cytochrome c553|nr:c-type cytochrome [Azoarcus sp.]